VVGAIVAGIVTPRPVQRSVASHVFHTQPHRGRAGTPQAHGPLIVPPPAAQGTPAPPPPRQTALSARHVMTRTGLVRPSTVQPGPSGGASTQGLASPTSSPTVVVWPASAAGRGQQNG